ncbi:hypothetical protein L6164_018999 [Bauhinia variegata]|uniref:Uncharacterized protein n=1 Tax=Bauhinia variegata TaxID=167791 RepID=A0ACB9ND56_BAUVA|nr:hypothetical protein L6164_018999 [Bauhinia variegata]
MEFWGVEVKSGQTVKVDPEEFDAYIHLSQAALGESKKDSGSEAVVLHLKTDNQKLVLGTLSREKFPQLSFDIVLDKEFELSHNWKNGSVYFCGYKAEMPDDEVDFDDESNDDEDLPVISNDNGKTETKTEEVKNGTLKKPAAKGPPANQVNALSKKDEEEDSEDDDDDSDEEDDEAGSSDEDMMDADSDSDDGESDEDDEETPPKKGKKRPNDSASKTPIPLKKAKSATPQKTDSKKGGHTATPHPKKDIKTPNSDSKSGGQFSCKSCSKSFNSEGGLQQHSKAKHG